MLNMTLIDQTVSIVIDYFEAEGICEQTKTIMQRAIEWYNNTEITNPQTLAAAVISGNFRPSITYNEIVAIEKFFFPIDEEYFITHNNYSIQEIEAAQYDIEWQ